MQKKELNKRRRRAQLGMTLVEIMVVIVIIGMVMGMVGASVFGSLGNAQRDVASSQIKKFGEALDLYKLALRKYPSTGEGLNALVSPPNNQEPFMKEIPKDPWDNPYSYVYPGTHNQGSYDICSNGPDMTAGTSDDVCNYETAGSM
jgi:general secretion pathway protein G